MSDTTLIGAAAAPLAEIVRTIKPDQLAAPTPCSEYDVRGLVNHLLFWGPSLVGAARKETVPPPAAAEEDVDLTDGDWAAGLHAHLDRLVAAWSEPAAWDGTTTMGGPTEMPAAMIGRMVLGELVVHGWDLARATGQQARWPEEVLAVTRRELVGTAEQGRQLGIYGPEVPVPPTGSAMDHILGLAGRDPDWNR